MAASRLRARSNTTRHRPRTIAGAAAGPSAQIRRGEGVRPLSPAALEPATQSGEDLVKCQGRAYQSWRQQRSLGSVYSTPGRSCHSRRRSGGSVRTRTIGRRPARIITSRRHPRAAWVSRSADATGEIGCVLLVRAAGVEGDASKQVAGTWRVPATTEGGSRHLNRRLPPADPPINLVGSTSTRFRRWVIASGRPGLGRMPRATS